MNSVAAKTSIPAKRLPAFDKETELANAIVEAPRGSTYKYKFNPATGLFHLHKRLPAGAAFPFDFGFIPGTEGEDGDPLDVLLLLEEPAAVGTAVPARLIGVIEAEQTEGGKTSRNDRLLAVLETPFNPPPYKSLDDLDDQLLAEIEHFFVSYNEAEGRVFKPIGRGGPQQAVLMVKKHLLK
ncbi:MAG TPA: inorganic diphosphatase [Pirellulales bacterium]|nr:inorganic diphosphatase [Pirellulales bacterium]